MLATLHAVLAGAAFGRVRAMLDELGKPVAEARAGFSIPAERPDTLVETLLEIGGLSPGHLCAIGARGRQYIEQTHSYAELARRYAELF